MKIKFLLLSLLVIGTVLTPPRLSAQSFTSYPEGDDVTSSLGQFQLILEPEWRRVFDLLIPNSPLANVMVTRHKPIYRRGVFISPTLYDPTTTIGRSASFRAGGPLETYGTLAGRAPGRTYIKDSQLTVRPTWSSTNNGGREVHTFIKSMNLRDSFTTRVGFAVRAGMQAPKRRVSAGQVEAGGGTNDFPARSFFNVFVEVDLPGGGVLPAIQLVNLEPLLVEQTNVTSFPPRIIYQHGNSTAVSMYFNNEITLPDPAGGDDIHVARGTLFGQLTLAGHGVGFGQFEIESFQAEIENEIEHGVGMPVNPVPIPIVQIEDFAPDYNATAPTLLSSRIGADGSFIFTVGYAIADTTNYVQVSTNLGSGPWETIATIVPTTNSFTFTDSNAGQGQQRFYRWMAFP